MEFSSNTSKNLKWDYQMQLEFIIFFPLYNPRFLRIVNIYGVRKKKEGIDSANYEYDAEKVKRERK